VGHQIKVDDAPSRLISTEKGNQLTIKEIDDPIISQKTFDNQTTKGENISVNISPSEKNKNYNNKNTVSQESIITNSSYTVSNSKNNLSSIKAKEDETILISLSNSVKTKVVIPMDGMSKRTEETIYIPEAGKKMWLQVPEWTHPILNLSLVAEVENLDIVPPKKSRFSLSLQSGATFWQHQISETYINDLSAADFNYKDSWGWQTGLTFNFDLNEKVGFFAGINYEQIKTQSGHNSAINYSIDNEADPANPLNNYVLSLATPYGISGSNFNLNRLENIGANEVDLLVDFHSNHTIRNFSVPFGSVLYPIGKKRKLVPFASLGFGVNYLSNISNEINSIETHHDAIQFDDSGSSEFVNADVTQWHFDYRVGAGLNYELNRRLSLSLNYNFAKGINPIFELDTYNTRINRHQIRLGLTTNFSR
jgi:opacity protein-like surface antigen